MKKKKADQIFDIFLQAITEITNLLPNVKSVTQWVDSSLTFQEMQTVFCAKNITARVTGFLRKVNPLNNKSIM